MDGYKYYAFISYKREDEKWAKWIQRQLEYYRLPSVVRKENPSLPQYIRPVFRDKTDLKGGGRLADNLKGELHSSRHLIVVCSPNSVKSEWVNKEVEDFIASGRVGDIIPFIVGGEPHSKNPANECFPEALRNLPPEDELLGVNVKEGGKRQAFVKLVARMLDVEFDTLWQRYRRRQRAMRLWAAAACCLLAVVGAFWFDYTRVKYEYFADYADCNGVPKGIIPLTDEVVSHRYSSYRMTYSRVPFGEKGFYSWRLKRVEYVNSAGQVIDINDSEYRDRTPAQEFVYADGYLSEIIYEDRFGKRLMRIRVTDDAEQNRACIFDFEKKEQRQGNAYLGSSVSMSTGNIFSTSDGNKSRIKRYAHVRNDEGYIVKTTFHAHDGDNLDESAICDADGIFGMEFELDSLGRRVKVTYIDRNGKPLANKFGVVQKTYVRGSQGGIVEECNFDIGGNLVNNDRGYAMCKQDFDSYGNCVRMAYYSPERKPAYDTFFGVGKVEADYGERGFVGEYRMFAPDGKPCNGKELWHKKILSYDSRGNIVEESYFGIDGKPCFTSDGYSMASGKYDSKNRLVESKVYDAAGKPCLSLSGINSFTIDYDSNGEIKREEAFGIDGKPIYSPQLGFASYKNEYDDYGNLIAVDYKGVDGKPCTNLDGGSSIRMKYDNRGNVIERKTLGTDGKPCVEKNYVAVEKRKIDDFGNLVELAYFDEVGKPMFNNGYASMKTIFDSKGNKVEQRFYDANGSLCNGNDWFAIAKYEYDANGNITKESYFNADSAACYKKDGIYSIKVNSYDGQNNLVAETMLDTNGKPMLGSLGYHSARYTFNSRRNIVGVAYFGENGKPCLREQQYHKCTYGYDAQGRFQSVDYFGIDGRRCLVNGSSRSVLTYDQRGLTVKKEEFDASGKRCNLKEGYSIFIIDYDDLGREVSKYCLDKNGKPTWSSTKSSKTSKVNYEYDSRGKVVKESYFDPAGKPTVQAGWAVREIDYNDRMLISEVRYKDVAGKPMGGEYGKPIERYTYDGKNHVVRLQLLNADGSVYVNYNNEYDVYGRDSRSYFTDANGKPVVISVMNINMGEQYASSKKIFDKYGNLAESSYYDEKGKLSPRNVGYARITYTHDERGRFTSQQLFDENGKPVNSITSGFSRSKNAYDKYGNLIEQSFYDKDGRVARTPWEWGRLLMRYNERGECVHSTFYTNVNGKIVVSEVDNGQLVEQQAEAQQQSANLIVLRVEGYGQMFEKGFRNMYYIFEFNDWTMHDGIDKFAEALMSSRDKPKRLVLWSFDDQKVTEFQFSNDPLSARIMDETDPEGKKFKDLSEIYMAWKKSH